MARNLIFNGDFSRNPVWNFDEAGKSKVLAVEWGVRLPGWTFNALKGDYADYPGKAIDIVRGDYAFEQEEKKGIQGNAVELIGRTIPGYLQQVVATEPGESYEVSFWAGYAPWPGNDVAWAGIKAEALDGTDETLVLAAKEVRIDRKEELRADSSRFPQWRQVVTRFTAKSQWTVIRFSDTTAANMTVSWTGGVIADVQMTHALEVSVQDRNPQPARRGQQYLYPSVDVTNIGKQRVSTETIILTAPEGVRFTDNVLYVQKDGRPERRYPGTLSNNGTVLTVESVPLDLAAYPDPDRTTSLWAEVAVDNDAPLGVAEIRYQVGSAPVGVATINVQR
ncbi:hypothetical protein [Streptomyces griseocarneus]|uniref:hypothetical protein n=1 Tax=Streptomyces griseocarneus TaxID=51201 RepID=UPI00167CDC1B|nr:hypothetical protein [Streptomyces griseocarneus]MBZ6476786.1 hypothetical protein [Streptomyces griseocarneus]GHG81460.1 hypothetical protein GCM10018779_63660 [Streptomyces griseocarneus]